MKFSEHFGVLHTTADDWFDPILGVDTKLFVDPFLIFGDDDPTWARAHDRIVAHFQHAFELLAAAGYQPGSLGSRSALRVLQFPEPSETCLGYTAGGTRGSGSGRGFSGLIAGAMCDAIARGTVRLRHFEELGILNEGIGPDRISDITCTILKPELVSYTQRVATARAVPLRPHQLRAGAFDANRPGFVTATVELPPNPVTGGPLLLVPKRFLRDLPTINAEDWWDAVRSTELRHELNADLAKSVRKKDIVAIARRHPEKVAAWVQARERQPSAAYDLVRDPNGVYQWDEAARRFARRHPVRLVDATSGMEFASVIDVIAERFAHFIEENGGWRLLWDGEAEKREEAAQLVFLAIAKAYCEASDIVVDREVQLGRGPVDFKFSSGYRRRALLEVKKLENGRFWNGLRDQLPSYLGSDDCRDGWFLVVRFRSTDGAEKRARALPAELRRVATERGVDLRYRLVDARPKTSASKLEPPDAGTGVA